MKTNALKSILKNRTLFALLAGILTTAHPASAALFTTNTAIAAGDTNYDGEDILVMGCTVTIDGPHTFSDLFIFENGIVTHSPFTNGAGVGLSLIVSNSVFIDAGSKIDADGQGFAAGNGIGPGSTGLTTDALGLEYTSGGGGAYGGYGGASVGGRAGGHPYGSMLISDYAGSGGGAGFGPGGAGGGTVHLTVGETLTVDGEITANGIPGLSVGSGGGAGGGILITAGSTFGFGSITANGGAGEPEVGGGGGGGRIALFIATNNFSGTVAAQGGAGALAGGAGTVYLRSPTNSHGMILVDNGGLPGANTPLFISAQDSLSISGGAACYFSNNVEQVSDLTVGSNSWVVSEPGLPLQLTVTSNALIESNGGFNLSGAGSLQGPGPGRFYLTNGTYFGGGGGHAGLGGNGVGAASGGESYDSYVTPTESGSSGGRGAGAVPYSNGGAGGGVLKLSVTKTLTFNGLITVDGDAGAGEGSGGGSGGSVWLIANRLAGSGTISANGGRSGSAGGGGGGGGCIAVIATNDAFTGRLVAHGGRGFVGGGAGTIFVSSNAVGTGEAILDNCGLSGTNTPLGTSFAFNLPGLNLTVTSGAIAEVEAGLEVQNLLIASNSFMVFAGQQEELNVGKSALIELEGGIVADGAGNSQAIGDLTLVTNGITTGGGAGNAGYGGRSALGAQGGNVVEYGLLGPNESHPGSGGGGKGGAGGGALQLGIAGSLTLNGRISANGAPGLASGSGGGSGGSISITAARVAGTGALSANGGAGNLPYGGGGGGGMIVLSASTNQFAGTATAYGGNGAVAGGAGIVFEQINQNTNHVLIDNGGLCGTNTPISEIAGAFDLSIVGGAIAIAANGFLGQALDLFIGSNSFLTAQANSYTPNWSFTKNVTIQPTGGITLDGKGNPAGVGPGAGRLSSGGAGGGGGYGGSGGAGQGGAAGGGVYGSSSEPETAGSGGAIAREPAAGSQGGGAINLTVGGILSIGGKISANGAAGVEAGAGGGSGGSIFLKAIELTGSGSITANGGSGQLPAGGGGGGGRILLSVVSNQFTGLLSAYGGAGFAPGGAGTIRTSLTNLLIDGGGAASGSTVLQPSDVQNAGLTIRGGGVGLFPEGFGENPLRSLSIASNSFLLQTNPSFPTPLSLVVSGNVTVQAGGGIVMDAEGSGTGVTGSGQSGHSPYGYATGGGGGHGGNGGNGQGALGGVTFDAVEDPTLPGSSGGNDGGAGGGALSLRVTGVLDVDGVISANGADAVNEAGGGGSGGSIYLSATSLLGSGTISANGGAANLPNGGGGGGGRISLNYQSNLFAGEVTAIGGAGYQAGGAGTIYLNPAFPFTPLAGGVSFPRQVIVNNGGNSNGAATPLGEISKGIPANQIGESYDLIISGAADVSPTASWSLRTLLVETNSFISQSNISVNITVLSNALVQSNAAITADGQGWDGDTGPDPGTTASDDTSSGGGYGGMGGASAGAAAGGATNGSVQMPVGWGSGGGVLSGKMVQLSQGGGAISLTAGTLTMDGTVSANGVDGTFPGAGGGAGGSVWLSAGTLAGAGVVTANGGSGQIGVSGGGGGGRLAIYALTNEFSGSMSVNGGPGFAPGGNGTIYLTNSGPVTAQIAPEAALLSLAQPPNTSLATLTWTGIPGAVYQVQSTTDFVHWQPLGAALTGSDGLINLRLSTAAEQNRFFRLMPAN
ncbi:MAG: beta strand repeat-containing protein [Limisphaerales bacterium]